VTGDDRVQFETEKRADAARLASDVEVQRLNRELTAAADRHNFFYQWSWLGLPVIQTPTDIVILQEIVWNAKPDVIVETGVARGGSMILAASLLEMIGGGRVIGIDIDIRAHNRAAIEEHPMAKRVSLIEGGSTDAATVDEVQRQIGDAERVMVILDSHHSHDHVRAELEVYAPLVTVDQYLVVADTIIEELPEQTHRPRAWGIGDNPKTALDDYLKTTEAFELDEFIAARQLVASSPGGYLRRVR
jgi:cephalosporin hydroxylase